MTGQGHNNGFNMHVSNFNLIQEVCNYLNESPQCWDKLETNLEDEGGKLIVKPLSETRWLTRVYAIRPFKYCIGAIYDTSFEIS